MGGEEGCCCPNREKIGTGKNAALYSLIVILRGISEAFLFKPKNVTLCM
jgi:hypothetical protein